MPNSRTAIAYNDSYVFFIVIDGWHAGVSEGISILELGGFAIHTLQASDAVTLDSGGSSTMVINGQVVNNTYCNFTRKCGMQPEHERDRPGRIDPEFNPALEAQEKNPSSLPAPAVLEPFVGNAWMMLVVEPKVQSSQLEPDQLVMTNQPTELRLGPGTNYAQLALLVAGAQGVVLYEHYNDLHGVLAKGAYWQPVKFGTQTGWVRQNTLIGLPDPGENPIFMPVVRR